MKTISLIFLIYILNSFTFARTAVIGSVKKVRGNASALFIGERDAIKVRKGMKIRKDTSILTSKKSFVQIKLLDNSQLSIGPNSKTLVDKIPATKTGFITLLKGQLRSSVKKTDQKKSKLIIKTQTAALGVRGTDFSTTYNPESKITNLLTFTGKVAIKKVKVKEIIKKEDIIEDLKTANIVEVEKGTFSSVSDNLAKATIPVKISPVQFTRVKLNKELKENVKDIKKEVFKKELKKTIKLYKEISKKEKLNKQEAKRIYSAKKKKFKPTAGGFIDFSSGIYVPPTISKENLDKDLNIYKIEKSKGVVTRSGSYIAPKGLKLDAKKGFVVTSTKVAKNVATKLNQQIKAQLVKPKKPTMQDINVDVEDAYDKYFKIK